MYIYIYSCIYIYIYIYLYIPMHAATGLPQTMAVEIGSWGGRRWVRFDYGPWILIPEPEEVPWPRLSGATYWV